MQHSEILVDDELIERDKKDSDGFRRSWFIAITMVAPTLVAVAVIAGGALSLHYFGQ